MQKIRNIFSGPCFASGVITIAMIMLPGAAFAAGTQFISNGSSQIGTFPSSLPNTSFRIDTSTTNAAVVTAISPNFVGPSSSTLTSTAGWTQDQNGSVDDGFKDIPLGFSILFNNVSRSNVYVGSNTYITFGSGSSVYSGLSASNPPYASVHLAAADNSYQKVFHKLDSAGVMRVRYEGNNSTSGTVGSPTIVYEAVFYSGLSYFDVHMGSNSRAGGDVTPPTITNVTSTKANGTYKVGEVIDINVTFSEAVSSTGNVTVTLETGATDRTCTFTVSNSTTGTCNYTVQAGDTSGDLTVNTISGTIKDAALNSMTNFVPATNLAANKALVIDTTAPTITSVSSDKANGSYKAGDVIDIDVNFSEAVTSTGNVTVTLETGVTDRTCTFTVSNAVQGTCNYTVQAGDVSGDLTVNTIAGTVNDLPLNPMTNFVPATNLAANKALVIDNIAPTITSVSSDKANGSYKAGDVIDIDVNFSEAVTSTGNVTVTLETGVTDRTCTFTVSNAVQGTCNYTVQAGDVSADLTVNTVAGTINDAASNAMTSFSIGTNLATNKALVIDTAAPTVSNATSTKANGTYKAGEVIGIDITFSEAVTSTGNVTVTLETGVTDRTCAFAISNSTSGTCNYTVQAGDTSGDLTINSVAGTINDSALNALTNTVPSTNLAANKALVIDTTAPVVTSVNSNKANGTYKAGEIIDINVTFSEAVTSTGNVTVTLETGATDRTCTFAVSNSASGSCNYIVQSGDNSPDLTVNTITGTINDAASNAMTNFTPVTNLAANKALVIDAVVPTVTGVTSSLANGSYKVGQVIPIQVSFSEAVTVAAANPQLTLATGSPVTTAVDYSSGSATNTLTFNYTVASGNVSADLDYASVNALSLNGATIKDAAGNDATLTLAAPGAANSLGSNKALVIDTAVPTAVLASTASATTKNSPIPVTAVFSESVTGFDVTDVVVTNGSAGNFSGSGSSYAFDVTPTGGSQSGLAVSVYVPASSGQDAAANQNAVSNTLARTYDNVVPTVTITSGAIASGCSAPPGPGHCPTNATPLAFTATFSEPVTGFTLSDISVTNGTAGNFVASSSTLYTFDVSPTGAPDVPGYIAVSVGIASSAAQDVATNASSTSSPASYSFYFDNLSPTVSLTSTAADPTNVTPIPVTATFNEDVTDFLVGDIIVTNGSAGSFVASSASLYTFNVTPTGQGTVTVSVPASAALDGTSNQSLVSNVLSRVFDTVAPTVTLTSGASNPTNVSPIPVTATFSSAVTGFIAGDISVTNGTAGNFVASSGTVYTFDVTPAGQGTVSVDVSAGVAADLATNGNIVAPTLSRTFDSVAPSLAVATAVPSPGNDTTPSFSFTSNEAGTISYSGDCTSVTTAATVGTNAVTFGTLSEGSHNNCGITVTDAVGNVSALLVVNGFVIDTTVPTISSIVLSDTSLSIGETSLVTVTFSEAVTGFDNADVTTIENGTLSAISSGNGGSIWTGTFTPTASLEDASNIITVTKSGLSDLAGNAGSGSTSSGNYAIDTLAPTVSIGSPSAASTNGTSVTYTVTYSGASAVTLSNGDITLNPTATASGSAAVTGSGLTTRTVTVSSISGNGTIGISIAANTATDAAGNAALGAGPSSTFSVDTASPTVSSIIFADTALSAGETSLVTITFNEAVTGFDNADITTIENGTLSAVSSSNGGSIWTATFTPAATLEDPSNIVTVTLTGLADAAGNAGIGTSSSANYSIETLRPTITNVTSDKADGNYETGEVIDIDVTFSEPVTSTGNVTVTLETGTVDRTCTFTVSGSNFGTCNYTVQAGDITSDLTTNSIAGTVADASGNAMTNFAPTVNLADNKAIAVVNTIPTVTSISSDKGNGSYNVGEVIDIDVTFSEPVTSTGNVTVTLETGTVDRTCTFSVSGSNFGTCNYTVQAGDITSDLDAAISGTIKDSSLNPIVNFVPATGLAANKNIVVDTVAPTILSVSSTTANGAYLEGSVIHIDVTFSEAVTSVGNVRVTLETGVNDQSCSFTVSNSSTGTCDYTVQAGDNSIDLSVNLIEGDISDASLNAMTNFVPATNLDANKNISLVIPSSSYREPAVFLASHNGGEKLRAGAVSSVFWSSNGVGTVKLKLSSDGGATFPTTIYEGAAGAGTYAWTVPDATGSSFRLRLEGGSGSPSDDSDSNFSIISAYGVTLTSPNGGESVKIGGHLPVSWQSDATAAHDVALQLSVNGGNSYPTVIASGLADTGSYDWVVPDGVATTSAKVRVQLTAGGIIKSSDASNLNFAITAAAVVVPPGVPGNPGKPGTPSVGPTPPGLPVVSPKPSSTPEILIPKSGVPPVPGGKPPATPAAGPLDPAAVSDFLKKLGLPVSDSPLTPDGKLSPETVRLLVEFQTKHTESGELGPDTMNFINALMRRSDGSLCRTTFFGLVPPIRALTRTLKFGDRNEDVRVLQKFLNDNGFILAANGGGAPGHETDYFSNLTKSALQRFQDVYGLLTEKGGIGPKTSFLIRALSSEPPVFSCPALIPPVQPLSRNLQSGDRGDDVRVLQKFLNDNGYLLAVTGPGAKGAETVNYQQATRSAITRFQNAYGLGEEAGMLGTRTRSFINGLIGKQVPAERLQRETGQNQGALASSVSKPGCETYLSGTIRTGKPNNQIDVRKLQDFLRVEEKFRDLPTNGVFDEATQGAVKVFQERYAADILAPQGLTTGSGQALGSTIAKINSLVCDNDANAVR